MSSYLQWLRQHVGSQKVLMVFATACVRDENGRLLYQRHPNSWLKARSQLWHTYNDSLPFRRAAREQLRQFAEGVRRGH